MPYALIAMLAALLLGVRYLVLGDASLRSKIAVVAAVVASLVIWWYFPQWMVVAILLQVGVSLFVMLYLKVNPYAS
jgi:hypothetical protein